VWGLLPAVMGLASLAGYLSWHFVEAPWLRKSPGPSAGRPAAAASPAAAR